MSLVLIVVNVPIATLLGVDAWLVPVGIVISLALAKPVTALLNVNVTVAVSLFFKVVSLNEKLVTWGKVSL